MRVREALSRGRGQLQAAGLDAADFEAELLLLFVRGMERAALLARLEEPLPPADLERFLALVARRAAHEPPQYLTGRQDFWKHTFAVTPAVLIPRPETELLVERALRLLDEGEAQGAGGAARPTLIDVGTGSGCIAISLALEKPAAVHATDISPAALEVARGNAAALGANVAFHEGDLLAGAGSWAPGADLIVSNPPYVDPADRASLMPEVRDHEPSMALFPPGDPLHFYRRLAQEAGAVLRPGGAIAVEVGAGQAAAVSQLLAASGYDHLASDHDFQGIARVVHGRRR